MGPRIPEALLPCLSRIDGETQSHLLRIASLVRCLGRTLLPGEKTWVDQVAAASIYHDIGKSVIPEEVLTSPRRLTQDERRIVELHTLVGALLLRRLAPELGHLPSSIALTHHERWDGGGYPCGLRGEEIPLAGRLVSLADHYDALRSQRPYKGALSHLEAREVIHRGDERSPAGAFDPAVLAAFEASHETFAELYARYSGSSGEELMTEAPTFFVFGGQEN